MVDIVKQQLIIAGDHTDCSVKKKFMARAQGIFHITSCTCCSAHKYISLYQRLIKPRKEQHFSKKTL